MLARSAVCKAALRTRSQSVAMIAKIQTDCIRFKRRVFSACNPVMPYGTVSGCWFLPRAGWVAQLVEQRTENPKMPFFTRFLHACLRSASIHETIDSIRLNALFMRSSQHCPSWSRKRGKEYTCILFGLWLTEGLISRCKGFLSRVHGEFVIERFCSRDLAPLSPNPAPCKLPAHGKRDRITGASAGQTGHSPGSWRNPSRSR